ncbi:unnamed protein product, partial [Ascophyllum nodosum]
DAGHGRGFDNLPALLRATVPKGYPHISRGIGGVANCVEGRRVPGVHGGCPHGGVRRRVQNR